MGEFVPLVASIMALTALDIDSMLPVLPVISDELGVTQGNHRQYVITAFMLGFAVAQLFHGPSAIAPTIVPPSPSRHYLTRAVAAVAVAAAAIAVIAAVIAATVTIFVTALRWGRSRGDQRGADHRQRGAN